MYIFSLFFEVVDSNRLKLHPVIFVGKSFNLSSFRGGGIELQVNNKKHSFYYIYGGNFLKINLHVSVEMKLIQKY